MLFGSYIYRTLRCPFNSSPVHLWLHLVGCEQRLKFIVAGSRHIGWHVPYGELVKLRIKDKRTHPFAQATEIVSGHAKGADEAGEVYADFYDVPLKVFEAEWEKYGNRAGPIRNSKMAVYADALVLIWDGKSKGSRHMKEAMLALNKPVYEIIVEPEHA